MINTTSLKSLKIPLILSTSNCKLTTMTYFPLPPQPPPSPVCASSEPRTPIALESISDRFNSGFRHFNPELATGLRGSFNKSDSDTLFSLSPEGRTDPNCFSKKTLLLSSNHAVLSNDEIDYGPENTIDSNIAPSMVCYRIPPSSYLKLMHLPIAYGTKTHSASPTSVSAQPLKSYPHSSHSPHTYKSDSERKKKVS
jgi:hypothetical protein